MGTIFEQSKITAQVSLGSAWPSTESNTIQLCYDKNNKLKEFGIIINEDELFEIYT